MRLWVLLFLACGAPAPAFAPVSAVLDFRGTGVAPYMSAAAVKKLNPNCAANCELGAAFPDGGASRTWYPLAAGGFDGGISWGLPQDVVIGAEVEIYVSVPNDPPSCDVKHTVPQAGFVVTAVADDRSCSFSFR